MRQLPEVTRVQLEGSDVREVAGGDGGRSWKLPSIVVVGGKD
jgi:hypothetical protein